MPARSRLCRLTLASSPTLYALAVGQEPQLGLVLLARDREDAIGDDRVAEPVGPGDADDVAAPLGIVDPEARAIRARSWRRSRAACARSRAR